MSDFLAGRGELASARREMAQIPGWICPEPEGWCDTGAGREREFLIENLLVRIHFIVEMIRRTGLAPWEFEFPVPGSVTSTFLVRG